MEGITVVDAITISGLVMAIAAVSWKPGYRAGLGGSGLWPAMRTSYGRSVVAVVVSTTLLSAAIAAYCLVEMCVDSSSMMGGSAWEIERIGFWFQLRLNEANQLPISCPTCRAVYEPFGVGVHRSARAAGYLIGFVAPLLCLLAAVPSAATAFLGWHFGTQVRISFALTGAHPDEVGPQAEGSA